MTPEENDLRKFIEETDWNSLAEKYRPTDSELVRFYKESSIDCQRQLTQLSKVDLKFLIFVNEYLLNYTEGNTEECVTLLVAMYHLRPKDLRIGGFFQRACADDFFSDEQIRIIHLMIKF